MGHHLFPHLPLRKVNLYHHAFTLIYTCIPTLSSLHPTTTPPPLVISSHHFLLLTLLTPTILPSFRPLVSNAPPFIYIVFSALCFGFLVFYSSETKKKGGVSQPREKYPGHGTRIKEQSTRGDNQHGNINMVTVDATTTKKKPQNCMSFTFSELIL